MKSYLRILALLLIICTAAALFAACGTKTTEAQTGDDDDDDGYPENYPEHIKGLDFSEGGEKRTIRFVVSEGDHPAWARSIALRESDDPEYNVNAAVIERNKNVEKELGVIIELTDVYHMGAVNAPLEEIFASALDIYDVVSGFRYETIATTVAAAAGCYLDYSKIAKEENFLDPDAPYWDSNAYDELGYKGHHNWVTGDLAQSWVGTIYVAFVNQRIWGLYKDQIKEITGYSDIYDVVKNNKWTMDTLIELSKLCYVEKDGNGVPSEGDQLGYVGVAQTISNCEVDGLCAGCHVNYTKWVDGVPKMDFYNDRNVKFADKLYTLMTKSNAYTPPYDSDEHDPRLMFPKGDILCIVYWLNTVETEAFTEMKDDYYIVPCPMLDEEQAQTYGYSTSTHDGVSIYGIPYTCQGVDAATATLEAMGYWSLELTTPAYYEVALKNRYTRDLKSAEMIDLVRAGVYSDFAAIWSHRLGDLTWFIRQNCQARNLTSAMKTKARSWNTMMDRLLTSLDEVVEIQK